MLIKKRTIRVRKNPIPEKEIIKQLRALELKHRQLILSDAHYSKKAIAHFCKQKYRLGYEKYLNDREKQANDEEKYLLCKKYFNRKCSICHKKNARMNIRINLITLKVNTPCSKFRDLCEQCGTEIVFDKPFVQN